MSNEFKILSINPGSTSTKFGIFEGGKEKFKHTIRHSQEDLQSFKTVYDQYKFRTALIEKVLKENSIDLNSFDAFAVRGGVVNPCPSGVYKVTDEVCDFFKRAPYGEHASNLGSLIGRELGRQSKVPSYFVNPVVVDEMDDIARYAGHPLFERRSIFHALNQISIVKRYTKETKQDYKKKNFVVVHLGGGISIGLHKGGRVVDVNNALYGEGAFSPERSGTLPTGQLVDLCFSGKYTKDEITKMLVGKGGVVAYLGSNNLIDVMDWVHAGNKKAIDVIEAMIYQIAKEIGALATVVDGKLDNIIITGGLAREKYIVDKIIKKTSFLAPVKLMPGEDELMALTEGVCSVLKGEEEAKILELN